MERHMDNKDEAGAGSAVEQASDDIDRRHKDEDAGAGPEMTRHIARENPETSEDGEKDDDAMDEDDEDEDLEEDAEEKDAEDDAERGTPGYGDRGTTPV
jgi:hypothetical protein